MCAIGHSDPVKAERYEDGILRARERMQRLQDEKASEHEEKVEEVHLECVRCVLDYCVLRQVYCDCCVLCESEVSCEGVLCESEVSCEGVQCESEVCCECGDSVQCESEVCCECGNSV